MNRATNWSIFGGDKVFRVNPAINDGNVNSMVFSAGVTTLASLDTRDHGWDAQVQFEKAGDFTAGDFAFSQLLIDVRRYQPLGEHLNINLRVRGGMSDGLLPQQRAFELGGPGTLPGYRFKEFAGSSVALLNAEFIIRSTIAGNARGWARNLLSNTNLILFADAGSTNAVAPIVTRDVSNGALPAEFGDTFTDNWKSDAGVAIGSANGDFRIGAAWRLDRSESPMLVLRFSRPF
jgi:outer membrane protein assembly factor BamA